MKKQVRRILLSNDDGLLAPGLQTLFLTLRERKFDVIAVAPDGEQSVSGHSLTLHKPIFAYQTQNRQYAVSGTPADCVYFGVAEVFKKEPPDLIIAGINRGANLGNDVYYSGTVAAAREGYLTGFPSIAVSLAVDQTPGVKIDRAHHNFETAADIVLDVIERIVPPMLERADRFLLNINVPDVTMSQIKGEKICQMGERHYANELWKMQDPRNRNYYWIAGHLTGHSRGENADVVAVDQGYVSISPLQNDCSNPDEVAFLRELMAQ